MTVERQHELERAAVVEVADRDSDQRDAAQLDDRRRGREQQSRGLENRLGIRGRVRQRVRARCPREVVEAQSKHDGSADPPGSPHAARDAVDEGHERRVDLGG